MLTPEPGMRPVIRVRPHWRVRPCAPAFLLPFGCRHLLLEPSCSRHGIPRCCLPAGGHSSRTVTGFSTFRTFELHPVPGASYTPGPWCSPGCLGYASQHCRIPAAALYPRNAFHHQGSSSRGFAQRFTLFTLPDFPSPVASGWNTGTRASPRSFTPHSADTLRRMPGAETGAEHSPGTNRHSWDPPFG